MTAAWQDAAIRSALRTYFIMGSNNCRPGVRPEHVLAEALQGGATLFQYREKGTDALRGKERAELAWRLRLLCREHGVPFVVNDDAELAMEVEADGVHVGQDDERASSVRRRIGAGRLLGVSAYDAAEAEAAVRAGADYLGVGPIYATSTKEDAKTASGIRAIEAIRARCIALPIVAIGGISAANAAEVIRAGADGVSAISAISLAEEPREAARRLAAAVRSSADGAGSSRDRDAQVKGGAANGR
ncbi:thiamine phosphate synthase [Cohnella fermenti]|uniref:Thiamine-phosphate synthase n=1 Tax=Cohnella fermenti TaxID=2565925 RepID=A0A4V3WFD9_9BACL|nr:thiamine phosphate synthase [Cohnella fermenti]THF79895.1 thiamine phosphate synthase [Cohnella fermenti]